ncbi:MAG: hypothetical protein J3K34DRAFT_525732 [Monoraphidium minutum]|nr:MAG: hypothetical protein J3K34DRAFT_525732 [Monoraphidium minutum]
MDEISVDPGSGPSSRIKDKTTAAAVASSSLTALYAFATGRPVLRSALPVTINCTVAMATLAAAQEGVRALRGGESDPWGTLAAGALTGATLVGLRAGRGFALLGAVTWGPAAAAAHAVDGWLRPGRLVETFLISQGLVDEPAAPGGPRAGAGVAPAGGGRTVGSTAADEEELLEFHELTQRRQSQLINALKQRETRELNARLDREAAERAAAAKRRPPVQPAAAPAAVPGPRPGSEQPQGRQQRGEAQPPDGGGGGGGGDGGGAAAGSWWRRLLG